MKNKLYAPISVFAYNRPLHTERMLKSLTGNPAITDSEVIIYCDGPRRQEENDAIGQTREVVRSYAPTHATIVERDQNLGLARSIITGVTEICESRGRVIVIEDDLVLAPGALNYLNEALNRYSDQDRVMHISAYMYPVNKELPQAFFYREATCWGWATWQRAWKHFEPDATELVRRIDASDHRREFNLDDSMYFYQMLCKQRDGEINSWAIRWYASMFLKDGLALHPGRSFVQNLGFDGSGQHCNVDSRFNVELSHEVVTCFPDQIEESKDARRAMFEYRNRSSSIKSLGTLLMRRIYSRVKTVVRKLRDRI